MAKQTLSTQQFVEVREIKNGVVHLKNGSNCRVLMVSGINFDLKSEEEQENILATFQHFLNTLDFSVQFFIHSRKVNIERYLRFVEERRMKEESELLQVQIDDYIQFVRSFVEENPIITKSFFAVVSYAATKLPSAGGGGILGFFGKKTGGEAEAAGRVEDQKILAQLDQRVDEMVSGLEPIGVHLKPLDDEALTELFYNLYNPQLVEKEGLKIARKEDSPIAG